MSLRASVVRHTEWTVLSAAARASFAGHIAELLRAGRHAEAHRLWDEVFEVAIPLGRGGHASDQNAGLHGGKLCQMSCWPWRLLLPVLGAMVQAPGGGHAWPIPIRSMGLTGS